MKLASEAFKGLLGKVEGVKHTPGVAILLSFESALESKEASWLGLYQKLCLQSGRVLKW